MTKTKKKRIIKGWAAIGDRVMNNPIVYENGRPLIFIQKIKPKVFREKELEVIPVTIIYTI